MEDDELAKTVGVNVRAAREAAELTQEELGKRAGISAPNVSRLEAGTHLPCLKTLNKIAGALGVQVEDLVRKPRKGKK